MRATPASMPSFAACWSHELPITDAWIFAHQFTSQESVRLLQIPWMPRMQHDFHRPVLFEKIGSECFEGAKLVGSGEMPPQTRIAPVNADPQPRDASRSRERVP